MAGQRRSSEALVRANQALRARLAKAEQELDARRRGQRLGTLNASLACDQADSHLEREGPHLSARVPPSSLDRLSTAFRR